MRSHVSVQRATIKYFSNSFVFKNEIEKEGLPRDITPALGAGGRGFVSPRFRQYCWVQPEDIATVKFRDLRISPCATTLLRGLCH
jgi:hypothetical protein